MTHRRRQGPQAKHLSKQGNLAEMIGVMQRGAFRETTGNIFICLPRARLRSVVIGCFACFSQACQETCKRSIFHAPSGGARRSHRDVRGGNASRHERGQSDTLATSACGPRYDRWSMGSQAESWPPVLRSDRLGVVPARETRRSRQQHFHGLGRDRFLQNVSHIRHHVVETSAGQSDGGRDGSRETTYAVVVQMN